MLSHRSSTFLQPHALWSTPPRLRPPSYSEAPPSPCPCSWGHRVRPQRYPMTRVGSLLLQLILQTVCQVPNRMLQLQQAMLTVRPALVLARNSVWTPPRVVVERLLSQSHLRLHPECWYLLPATRQCWTLCVHCERNECSWIARRSWRRSPFWMCRVRMVATSLCPCGTSMCSKTTPTTRQCLKLK